MKISLFIYTDVLVESTFEMLCFFTHPNVYICIYSIDRLYKGVDSVHEGVCVCVQDEHDR